METQLTIAAQCQCAFEVTQSPSTFRKLSRSKIVTNDKRFPVNEQGCRIISIEHLLALIYNSLFWLFHLISLRLF